MKVARFLVMNGCEKDRKSKELVLSITMKFGGVHVCCSYNSF